MSAARSKNLQLQPLPAKVAQFDLARAAASALKSLKGDGDEAAAASLGSKSQQRAIATDALPIFADVQKCEALCSDIPPSSNVGEKQLDLEKAWLSACSDVATTKTSDHE
eukprot:3336609-Alexandrium_andersonii.AAC.1